MGMDWIRMRCDLADDPGVIGICEATGLDADTVVGKLHRFWSWGSRQTTDGNAPCVTANWLEKFLGSKNMVSALEGVGWLQVAEGGIRIPNFDRYLSESSKQRALTAQRVAALKTRKSNASSVTSPLPREDKNIDSKESICVDGAVGENPPAATPNKSKAERRLIYDPDDVEISQEMWLAIQVANPTQKPPNLEAWADTIRLLRKQDHRAPEQIRSLFAWASTHAFWSGVILSPKNLRKNWDQLQMQRTSDAKKRSMETTGRVRRGGAVPDRHVDVEALAAAEKAGGATNA